MGDTLDLASLSFEKKQDNKVLRVERRTAGAEFAGAKQRMGRTC